MKYVHWKNAAELLGITAIVASLIFVALQMRQAQELAVAEANLSLLSSRVEINNGMNDYADIWVRGRSGDELGEAEEVIFSNLVSNLNDRAFFRFRQLVVLGETEGAQVGLHDFAALLYQNPGARRIWSAREDNLMESRSILIPEMSSLSAWRDDIQADLAKLEQIQN